MCKKSKTALERFYDVKSTVVGLIRRFYDVVRGAVLIDGINLRELDVRWYRNFTAFVSQEPVVFSGSIRDNISCRKPDASEDEIVEAARGAIAYDFISALKEGYYTDCGDSGLQLSGGQKQRLAITRAILRNPYILLLDEATSTLDVLSKRVVQEALQRIMVGRTAVVVADRRNTLKNLDTIAFVTEEGMVIEQESYMPLTGKRGFLQPCYAPIMILVITYIYNVLK